MLALVAILMGVVCLLLAGGFIEWNLWYGRESTIHSQLGHIRVYRSGFRESGAADPYKYLLPARGDVLTTLLAQPHVVGVAPHMSFSGLASYREVTLSFVGEALDPARESLMSGAVHIVAGTRLTPGDSQGILVGAGLANNLGTRVGDTLVLIVNTESGGVNAVEGKVIGTFSTVSKAYDDTAIRVPLALAWKLTRVTGVHSWAVLLTDTEYTDDVVSRLNAALPSNRFEIVPWYDLADFYVKVAALYRRQFAVVKWIVAVVMVLGIANTMMMNVLERTREIGTMLALGSRRRAIFRMHLIEGALFGVVGGALGVAIGFLLARAISEVGIPMPPSPAMTEAFVAGIRITGSLSAESVALAVAAAVVAAAYPAWRASRMDIVDALRTGQ
jgi:putative ABC transport system permease protein